MTHVTILDREKIISDLKNNPEVDVLIVGAGINGIGTFRDLAFQNVNVLLIDKADFCSGASAASSHMVHGGIRYLENGEFRLVREAVQERNRLLENAPHLVDPLATVIPIFNWRSGIFNAPLKFLGVMDKPSERGAIIIKAGLTMYDAFTWSQGTVPNHKFQFRKKSLEEFPKLNPDILCTAVYYDAMMPSPERICIDLVIDAQQATSQARALNYVRVGSADDDSVTLIDECNEESYIIKPRLVVNAAGPWIDFANRDMGYKTDMIGGTKGSHLVLNHPELHEALKGHEFFFENDDGRIVLIFPLKDRVMIGTSDILIENPDNAVCTEEEIEYFLKMVERVFPTIVVDRSHIAFTFSGVRPLPNSEANTTGQISRDHKIDVIPPTEKANFPVLNLIGGKWTTFRAFAEKTADVTLAQLDKKRQLSTKQLPIGGGANFPEDDDAKWRWIQRSAIDHNLPVSRIETLFSRYGTKSSHIASYLSAEEDSPLTHHPGYSKREIEYLTLHEQVVHLDDLILRRTLIGMLGETTAPLLEEVATIIAPCLGWDDERVAQEVERTKRIFKIKHRVVL